MGGDIKQNTTHMKLNQKILKAINEGIRKSLLSFDDNISFDETGSSGMNHQTSESIEEWNEVHENFVDLGLPSRTLWCKHNLGATCGDVAESWIGDYYAWGELTPKDTYEWTNYKYGQLYTLSKYNRKGAELDLDLSDDVVYMSYVRGKFGIFKMPSKEDVAELQQLKYKTVKNYNGVNGLNGRLYTGYNGNTLFIPAGGSYSGAKLYGKWKNYCIWTSTRQFEPDRAVDYSMVGGSTLIGFGRFAGLNIRPIYKKNR